MSTYRVIMQKSLKDDPASMYLESRGSNNFSDAYKQCVPGGELTYWHIKLKHAVEAELATGDPVLVSYNEQNNSDFSLVKFWIQKPLNPNQPLDLAALH